jgi:uncharacterized membrane protein YhdT
MLIKEEGRRRLMNLLEEYGIKEDPRFKQARKETYTILWFVLIETVWVFSFAIWGDVSDPKNYKYVMGVPEWFFWSFLGAGIIFPLIALFLGSRIEDCELTSRKSSQSTIDKNLPDHTNHLHL